jgi:hypothetical protein
MTPDLVPFTRETLEPIAVLGDAGVLTATSMELHEKISYEQYEALGTALGAFDRACRWWVGDWLAYGERTYDSDRYAQAAEHTGLNYQLLRDLVWQSNAIPPRRRRVGLGHSIHREVARLGAREQTRWLKWAQENQATVASLRAAIKLSCRDVTTRGNDGGDEDEAEGATGDGVSALIEQAAMATAMAVGALGAVAEIDEDRLDDLMEHAKQAALGWSEIGEALHGRRTP